MWSTVMANGKCQLTIDTSRRIVLDPQVNVLADAETCIQNILECSDPPSSVRVLRL